MTDTGSANVSTAQKWSLEIGTADAKHAGTEAELWCRILTDGRKNSTSPQIRCSDENKKSFKQAKTDVYEFILPNGLDGNVTTLQMWHNNKGNDWQPASLKLKNGTQESTFVVGENTKITAGTPHSFYVNQEQALNQDKLGVYNVQVQTSSNFGAGTDAKVLLNIIGTKSSSLAHCINNAGNDRERGSIDTYTLKSHDLGDIEKVQLIVKNTKTLAAAWNIDYIKVSNELEQSFIFWVDPKVTTLKPGNTYTFTGPEIILPEAEEEEPVVQEKPAVPISQKPASCQTKFMGVIETADEAGAGTDARVEIWFTDNDGLVVGPLLISEVNGDTMERGHKNHISVELVEKLNGLSRIQLRQGGEGFGDDWKLKRAMFQSRNLETDEANGPEMNFPFNKYLKAKEIYDIGIADPEATEAVELKTYNIKVKTTDKMWAGTDDTVKLNIIGIKGTSHFRKLANSSFRNNFERGNTDEFKLKLLDLGEIKRIELRKNGRDDWKCDEVSITDDQGNEYKFNYGGRKIGKKEEPCEPEK